MLSAGYSEYYNPDCEYRYQKPRRTKAANQQPNSKCYSDKTFIAVAAFSTHFSSLRYYIISERIKIVTKYTVSQALFAKIFDFLFNCSLLFHPSGTINNWCI